MTLALRTVKLAFGDFFEEVFWLVAFNIVWCLALAVGVLPLVALGMVALPLTALGLAALPLATAGLTWLAAEIGQGKAIGWRTFVAGARRHWKSAYYWFLANLVAWGVIWLNVSFYGGQTAQWAAILLLVFVAVAIWWAGMQLYAFPFLFVQERPSLRMAYRNSIILLLSRPALTFTLLVVVAILLGLSFFLTFPAFFFLFALLAVLGNRAVIETIKLSQADDAQAPGSRSRRP
jgi:uncharacterized membrane protein YesL